MIALFDHDRSCTIGFNEFCSLWKYVSDWKRVFDSFDRDRSGTIDMRELQTALVQFGYNLSPGFYPMVARIMDRSGTGNMCFDDFVRLSILLQMITNEFRKIDVQRQGWVSVGYEQYLVSVLSIAGSL